MRWSPPGPRPEYSVRAEGERRRALGDARPRPVRTYVHARGHQPAHLPHVALGLLERGHALEAGHAGRSRVVARQGQGHVAAVTMEQASEVADATEDVLAGIQRIGDAHLAREDRHELHEALSAPRRHGAGIEARLRADDSAHEGGIDSIHRARFGDVAVEGPIRGEDAEAFSGNVDRSAQFHGAWRSRGTHESAGRQHGGHCDNGVLRLHSGGGFSKKRTRRKWGGRPGTPPASARQEAIRRGAEATFGPGLLQSGETGKSKDAETGFGHGRGVLTCLMHPMPHLQPTHPSSRSPRPAPAKGKSRHSCPRCGQAFTLHYLVETVTADITVRVPCVADGCGAPVAVCHPGTAYAIWMEEF